MRCAASISPSGHATGSSQISFGLGLLNQRIAIARLPKTQPRWRMLGADGFTRRTVIGEPSDSKRKSYLLPLLSVAEHTTLVTWPVAKLPSCTHLPADFRAVGTGRPSTFGWFLELSNIRSTGRS